MNGLVMMVVAACHPAGDAQRGDVSDRTSQSGGHAALHDSAAVAAPTTPRSAPAAGASNTPSGTKRPTVLFVGTSLTAGFGLDDPTTEAFPAQVGKLADSSGLPITVINAGVTGETSAGALQRVGWLLKEPSDIIVLETGANDGLRGLSVAAARSNITQIITQFKAAKPKSPIVLVQMEAPPNLGSTYVTGFHALYGEIASAQGVPLTPFLLAGVAGIPRLNQRDGIHPTVAGAAIAAHTVWGTLEPIVRRYYP